MPVNPAKAPIKKPITEQKEVSKYLSAKIPKKVHKKMETSIVIANWVRKDNAFSISLLNLILLV